LTNDLKRLSQSLSEFEYREIHDRGGVQRACERWPLLAAIHCALRSEHTRAAEAVHARTEPGWDD
jgi:hypothetical protein